MNNQPLNDQTNREEHAFPIFKTAAFLSLLFMTVGLLVFFIKGGGLLLLYVLFGGDFCC